MTSKEPAVDAKAAEHSRSGFKALPGFSPVMMATAVFALVWLIVRAKIQSVTIDEANTCWWTIFPASPAYWLAPRTIMF